MIAVLAALLMMQISDGAANAAPSVCRVSAQDNPSADVGPRQAPDIGPAYVTLLGDYVGKSIKLVVDGRVLVERRMTFPPPGAEERYLVEIGPARTVQARIEIADCPEAWTGALDLEPGQTIALIFEGCAVRAPAAR